MAPSNILFDGWNTFQPICVAQTRNDDAIIVNGIDRGLRWNGIDATAEDLGIDAPADAPTIVPNGSGGNLSAGDYTTAYRYVDDTLPTNLLSNLSDLTTTTAAANDKFQWDDLSVPATARQVARVDAIELYRSTVGQATLLYRLQFTGIGGATVARIKTAGTFSAVNDAAGKVRMTVPEGHGLVVGATIDVTGTGMAYDTEHRVTAVTATTVDTDQTYVSDQSGSWTLEGYVWDDMSDSDFQDLDTDNQLPLYNHDGSENAYRFTPQPNFKSVAVMFQDRAWYGADVEYDTQTVSVTNGSATITGANTAWTTAMAGRYMYIEGETRPHVISSVTPATSITLEDKIKRADGSGLNYILTSSPDERNIVYYSEVDEPESVPETNQIIVQENVVDKDIITGMLPHGATLYVAKTRHLYRLSFARQPKIDVNVSLAAERGLVNQRCWATEEDAAYLMDQKGIYSIGARGADKVSRAGVQPISAPIQDLWYNGTIDWSQSRWFFCQSDPEEHLIKWYVVFNGDGTSTQIRPKRALCYNYRTGAWHTESYVTELGGACFAEIAGRLRVVAGGSRDTIYLLSEGTTDHVESIESKHKGTADNATSTSLVDTDQNWSTNEFWGAPVAIVAGTGKGQVAFIDTNTSNTLVITGCWAEDGTWNDGSWAVTPSTDSEYIIGGIPWRLKTGIFEFLTDDDRGGGTANQRGIRLIYEPTTDAATLDIRRYMNHDTSAQNNSIDHRGSDGITGAADDPDRVVDIERDRSGLGDAVGMAWVPIAGGRVNRETQNSDRWITYELRGVQGSDRIELYRIEVHGVRG